MNRLATLILLVLTLPALSATTSRWKHTTADDFRQGTTHNVVASSLGDLKLSRAIKTLLEQSPDVDAVYALAEAPDKTVYAGTGPKGVILEIKNEKVAPLLTLEDSQQIFSLAVDAKGSLLIGTGGQAGKIFRLEQGSKAPKVIFEHDGVQYIWSMKLLADGTIYAATGPEGQLFEIAPGGESRVVFHCPENNLLSLTGDGKDTLYVGTDPHGLIYKVNRKTGEAFVLYDAGESEITALVLSANGNLYAATGQSEAGEGFGHDDAMPGAGGRPETPIEGPADGGLLQRISVELPDIRPALSGLGTARRPTPAPLFPLGQLVAHEGHDVAKQPVPPKPAEPEIKPPHPQPPAAGHAPAIPDNMPTEGNAIYCIEPSGTTTEILRQPLPILSMIESDGKLLAGTGTEGTILEITPGSDETRTLAKVDAKQVMALLTTASGQVMLGAANAGGISVLTKGLAAEGTFVSAVLDATQISQFGKIQLHGLVPDGTALKVAARSGNLQEPGDDAWSKWSEDVSAAEFVDAKCPSARFFQYRLTLTSTNPGQTPTVEDVEIPYLQPNLAPQIKSITIAVTEKNQSPADADAHQPASQRHQTISWEASDPNADALEFSLYVRQAAKGEWILLKDKLTESTFEWDTRATADGRYEVKVVASDAKANPAGAGRTASRVSDPVLVDNTAPAIGDVKAVVDARSASVSSRIVDRTSTVAGVDFAIDSATDWQAVKAVDNIFDQPEESAVVKLTDLAPGLHQITLRATDAQGNQAFENVTVRIESPAASK